MIDINKYGVIYKITFPNGKVYIGQSMDFLKRKRMHLINAKKGKLNYPVYKAIRKYGAENISWKIIDGATSPKLLNKLERLWVKYCNSLIDNGNGYNLTAGGDKLVFSKCTIKKMSDSHKGLQAGNKSGLWGRKLTEEEIKRRTETREKNRIKALSNNKKYGKLGVKHKNKTFNPTQFKKGQVSHNKGKSPSKESIEKMKASLKLRYSNGLIPYNLGKKLKPESITKRQLTRKLNQIKKQQIAV